VISSLEQSLTIAPERPRPETTQASKPVWAEAVDFQG
jgi:hypothetical protein